MRDVGSVPRASLVDTVRAGVSVLIPLVGRGVILRRPRVMWLVDRIDADRRLVRLMQRLHARYGPGPVWLRLPGRRVALVLEPEDVERVLAESPEPFATANRDKRGALSHFQPHGVLVSHGRERAERRRFNEAVLNTARPTHQLADALAAKIREEAASLVHDAGVNAGQLGWDEFARAWWRIVRRMVLGDAARDDEETTDLLERLRSDANWAYLHPTKTLRVSAGTPSLRPKRTAVRDRFLRRLQVYVDRGEPGSLACLVGLAGAPNAEEVRPVEQMPQWLFAFDAAGMAAYRTLALLAAHPAELEQARGEPGYLRACVHESLRLWPTTPVILRDSTTETVWPGSGVAGAVLPAGTALAIVAPFFHRDDRRLPYADAFRPRIWLDERVPDSGSLVPFSGGPAECAGRNLVLFTTSTLLAALIEGHDVRLASPARLHRRGRLPGTLSPFRLRFAVAPLSRQPSQEHREAGRRSEWSTTPS
jgi:cytochrome P450